MNKPEKFSDALPGAFRKVALSLALAMLLAPAMAAHAETPVSVEQPKPTEPAPALRYKGINITLGGFLASEMVYRDQNMASDIATAFAKTPFANSAAHGEGELRGTERQSRFSLLAQGTEGDMLVSGYYELDFLGTTPTANANESNSYSPRTRNVYASIDWLDSGWHVLAGQNWSLATLYSKGLNPRKEALPQTIDAQYAVGFNWERQWQLRVTKDWEKTFWAAFSIENPQTVGGADGSGTYNLPGGQHMDQFANYSFNVAPDMIAKFAWDPSFGHFEVYDLARNFKARYGGALAAQTNKQSTWTDSVGAGVIVPVIAGKLDVSATGLYGKGAGRYGTSGLADVAFNSDGSLQPLTSTQYLGQILWHVNSDWEAYATYGEEMLKGSTNAPASGYGDGVVATDAGCNTLGGTCAPNIKSISQGNVGAWWTFYKGSFGAVKLGLQYSHTMLATFADASGFAPKTKENMGFMSLRFYPF